MPLSIWTVTGEPSKLAKTPGELRAWCVELRDRVAATRQKIDPEEISEARPWPFQQEPLLVCFSPVEFDIIIDALEAWER